MLPFLNDVAPEGRLEEVALEVETFDLMVAPLNGSSFGTVIVPDNRLEYLVEKEIPEIYLSVIHVNPVDVTTPNR